MDLVLVGINHHTAGLDLRERYAIPGEELPDRLAALTRDHGFDEAVLISTCNRVELYAVPANGADPKSATAAARAALGPPGAGIYVRTGDAAVKHLFRVASSLDSLVLGEPQILGQVKEAFAIAKTAGTVGAGLHGTFDRAFKAAKRVRTETAIARAAVSVGYVAVELAKTIFGDLSAVRVLLVGAGKMGILAARNLSDSGANRVQVANRTFARGKEVADRFGWTASAYADLPDLLGAVDVVICSTGATRPILTVEMVRRATKKRRYRPLFLIDIAVPRDIEPACGDCSDVYLYNIDDLEEVSATNEEGRRDAATGGEAIVDEELTRWARWRQERKAAPTIQQLREKVLAVAAAEAARTQKMLPDLDDKGRQAVDKLAEVVASKLIRGVITSLKSQKDGAPPDDRVADIVRELFELE